MYTDQVRRAVLIPVMLLGLGGVALAQPGMIVDPWPRPADVASSPPRSSAAFPIEPPGADVPRVASGLESQAERSSRVHAVPFVASGLDRELEAAARAQASRTTRVAPWPPRYSEIVDPWQRMPKLATIDVANLIVDPWAPSVRRAQGQRP